MNQRIDCPQPAVLKHEFNVLLSPTRRGARLARLLAVAHLSHWQLPTEAATQVVAELAANAVQHGQVLGRDFGLALKVSPESVLRIEVSDARWELVPATCHEPPAAPDAVSGRGLWLVATLADAWGVTSTPPHKVVWADLNLC